MLSDDERLCLPVFGDESYREGPTEGFDDSRAGGVAAFKAVALDSDIKQAGCSATAGVAANMKPIDFSSFLHRGGKEVEGINLAQEDDSMMASLRPRGDSSFVPMSPVKKRGRVAGEDAMDPPMTNLPSAAHTVMLTPPCPRKHPQEVWFGHVEGEDRGEDAMDPPVMRTDVFAWMRDDNETKSQEIIDLLADETNYCDEMQRHLGSLRDGLYHEMLGHQREADVSCSTLYPGGYEYYTQTFAGKSYQAHYRRLATSTGKQQSDGELVLDENELATDSDDGSQKPFCSVTGPFANPAHSAYACGVDFTGSDSYALRLFRLPRAPGQWSPTAIERTDGCVHWGMWGECLYYVSLDADYRPFQIRRHILGHDPTGASDEVLCQEDDKRFSVSLEATSCRRYLLAMIASSETSEAHLYDLKNPGTGFICVSSRVFSHRYSVDHREGHLYILTSKDSCKDSKLCRVPVSALPDAPLDVWEDVWVPKAGITLESLQCFQRFMVLQVRDCGEPKIIVHPYAEDSDIPLHSVSFPTVAAHGGEVLTPRGLVQARAAYYASLSENPIFDTSVIRYDYTSFTVPHQTFEYNVYTQQHKLIWQQPIPGCDASAYQAEHLTTSRRRVPISLVYRKDLHPQGLAGGPFPTVLTGYGAYGCCQDPDFDGSRLSLLDRGVVYALAHVRGGGELGRSWYEEGRGLFVKNRFADFVDVAEELIAAGITAPEKLSAWGTSSGGLLVTASMNMRPDLFRAVLLEVPFVDVLNTMCDPTVPLTVGEWEEIGNPNERDYFYYQLEYSPYDNLRMDSYPSALVTASLNDSMVGYWEPLKYVSKLRMLRANDKPTLLRANFHAGHAGAHDRYQYLRELAFQFAFLLAELGLKEQPLLDAPAAHLREHGKSG